MKKSIANVLLPAILLAVFSLSAIAGETPEGTDLAATVNCETAQADIDHLKHKKKSTDERKMKGVMSIMPIGLVINTASKAASSMGSTIGLASSSFWGGLVCDA